MLKDIESACAQMRQSQLIAQGKNLSRAHLRWYRQKVFRLLIQKEYWETYRATRSQAKRRAKLLDKVWDEACGLIVPAMSVREALDYVYSLGKTLSHEERKHKARTILAPE